MSRWMAILGAAACALAAQERKRDPDGLYLFFSPETPGVERIARDLEARPYRAVLLLEDYRAVLPADFPDAVKAVGRELPMVDEEGLALARRFRVSRTPCLVRVRDGRVHVAWGSQLNVKEVLECSR